MLLSNYTSCTIDEQLLSCKCRCQFIQYIPSKPGKSGIKFWVICDTDSNYVLYATPYVGKVEREPEVGLGEKVVLNLCENYHNSGLNITTDNFITSYSLAKKLKLRFVFSGHSES